MNDKRTRKLAQVQVTTDVVTFVVSDNSLKVLLVNRAEEPFKGVWSLPGGFLWDQETTEQAALRVLSDKAGVNDLYIEQLYTFDAPGRDPRGQLISVTHLTLVSEGSLKINQAHHLQQPTLFRLDELPDLAFDHQDIIQYAYGRLRAKLQYTNAVYSLLPRSFTFKQLQDIYESVLGTTVDRRNFRKKFMSLGLIKPTGKQVSGGKHRPAELYTFIDRKPVAIERWF